MTIYEYGTKEYYYNEYCRIFNAYVDELKGDFSNIKTTEEFMLEEFGQLIKYNRRKLTTSKEYTSRKLALLRLLEGKNNWK